MEPGAAEQEGDYHPKVYHMLAAHAEMYFGKGCQILY
jgi:hypothetical protein